MAEPNEPTEPTTVKTPEDERLPSIPDVRYGAFEVEDGTTVLYDRHAEEAWLRADCAVEVTP